jgi:hypothetical protein
MHPRFAISAIGAIASLFVATFPGLSAGAPSVASSPGPEGMAATELTRPAAASGLAGTGDPRLSPSQARTPGEILEAAFVNRYSIDLVTQIELVMRGRRGQERGRTIAAVTKVVDGRVYSIGRLLSPEYLRGMTILMMETEDRGQDAFVFMPSLDKVRRITTAQRSDAFFGSDLTYEDIEQQRAEDFEIDAMEAEHLDGEPVYKIRARPARPENYARVDFTVAQSDGALLKIQYSKRNAEHPYRVLRALREHMINLGGHVLPTQIRVENTSRGTHTEVRLTQMSIDLEIPTRIFSVRTLESRAPLPRVR